MNHAEATKSVSKVEASVAAGATHSLEIDTLGFAHASIDVLFSAYTAAQSSGASVLRLAESDTSGSGQANVSGMVNGSGFTVAAGSTTGANVGYSHRFDIDLRGHKRYLTVYATPPGACAIVTNARLSKGEQGPDTAAEKGVASKVAG